MMEETYIALGVFAGGWLLYWMLAKKLAKTEQEVGHAAEMRKILTDDKYKTKGRFEE